MIITFFILLFGEVIPKTCANKKPLLFTEIMALPISLLQKLIYPAVIILVRSTNILNPKVVDQLVNNSIRMLSREYEEIYEAINQKYEDNTLVYPEVTPQILNQILKIINNRYKS